jgi:hypothetical protein
MWGEVYVGRGLCGERFMWGEVYVGTATFGCAAKRAKLQCRDGPPFMYLRALRGFSFQRGRGREKVRFTQY